MNTYEGMFLIDNDVVRSGWGRAKSTVTELIQKHGGTVVTARRWDERRLAYPIKKKNRATYLLAYFQLAHDAHAALNRDLEIQETCLRHLVLRHEGAVPEEEVKATAAEGDAGFAVPEPPDDSYDEVAVAEAEAERVAAAERAERQERQERERADRDKGRGDRRSRDDDDSDDDEDGDDADEE